MNLEDLLEAHLQGDPLTVPEALRAEFECAVAGHAALAYALNETIVADAAVDREPPVLPEDYRVVRELGRGGMGVVYLVEQKSLERLIAVKVLRPGEAVFGRVVQRFLEEARHLARLRHANIVSVHEVGHAGTEPYFTMDYVEGQPLSAIIAKEHLTPTRALTIWKQAAAGVEHAHLQGIIHRDLKPGNILVDSAGRAYVTDFGLARDMTQSSQLTRTGEVMGTPAYMAPEQALGQIDRIGEATDVYALGVILYEMLTGTPPYGKDAPALVLVRMLKDEPVPPRKFDRRIPRDLETICLKAMSREPERRYATVRALLEDMHRFEAGQPVLARRPGVAYRTVRLMRRHTRLVAAVGATAAIVLAIALFIGSRSADDIVAEGDSQHVWGRHPDALQTYQRALDKSWSNDRLKILERMVRCAREVGDERAGVEAALLSLQYDPCGWFGEYNGRVAQAVIERRMSIKSGSLWGSPTAFSAPELAALRLRMFLAGPDGTVEERRAAEVELANVAALLGKRPEESMTDIFAGWKPREGTAEDLLKQSEDESAGPLERAQAAYSGALSLEQNGRRDEALAAYRRAFELLRRYQPVYFGLVGGIESFRPRSLREESNQWPRVLRHLGETIRRLDPEAPALLRGGLRMRVTGLDLPPELGLHIALSLWDPDVATNGRSTEIIDGRTVSSILGDFPVQLDQTAWVGVADGRYRIAMKPGSRSGTASRYLGSRGSQLFRMLQLDFSEMPEEIEIRGGTINLPAIRAYLLEEIRSTRPADNAQIEFASAEFHWNEVPDTTRYEVSFQTSTINQGGGTYFTPLLTVSIFGSTALRVASLPPADAKKLRTLVPGTTGVWDVRAYDAKGRLIAKTANQIKFVVARP